MKQEQQLAENLYKLAIELAEQVNTTDRSLAPPHSLWNVVPGSTKIKAELEKINEFSEKIDKHPGFTWMTKKPIFKEALQYFEKEIRKIQDSEFEIARMKIRLLQAIAGSGWQLLDDLSFLPRKIPKKEKDRAIEIATELLTFVNDGVGRPDYLIVQNMEEPLIQFIHHMTMEAKREYSGPADRQREIAIRFALCLRDFGLKQSKVVELLESTFSIFGFNLGHRTAQRHVAKAFAR